MNSSLFALCSLIQQGHSYLRQQHDLVLLTLILPTEMLPPKKLLVE